VHYDKPQDRPFGNFTGWVQYRKTLEGEWA